MSIKYIYTGIFLCGLASIFISGTDKTSGAHPGSTGAPGEATCAQPTCHTNASVSPGDSVNIITFGQPGDSVYEAGKVYAMKVTVNKANIKKFGFQVVSLADNDNKYAGQLQVTDAIRTNLQTGLAPTADRRYITHRSAGTLATTEGTTEWTFNWKAPSNNRGPVTFYVATNCTNNDNTNQHDAIFLSQLKIQPHDSFVTSIAKNPGLQAQISFRLLTNPVSDKIRLEYELKENASVDISLLNMEGKLISLLAQNIKKQAGLYSESYNLQNNIPSGMYLLHVRLNGQDVVKKLLVSK